MSQPHFYAGDPDLIESVIGLHPTPIEHQTILDVEPVSVRCIHRWNKKNS